jgi:hypothetical protein
MEEPPDWLGQTARQIWKRGRKFEVLTRLLLSCLKYQIEGRFSRPSKTLKASG